MQMENFKRDFVLRTKYIIENEAEYNTFEVTLLLNSLLGLLTLPINENEHYSEFYRTCLEYLNGELKIYPEHHVGIEFDEEKEFKAIRNAIAHGRIFVYGDPEINMIELQDTVSYNDSRIGIIYKFPLDKLKKFAIFVANYHLEYGYPNFNRNLNPITDERIKKKILTYYSVLDENHQQKLNEEAESLYNLQNTKKTAIKLYDLPVSAGTGEFLHNENYT